MKSNFSISPNTLSGEKFKDEQTAGKTQAAEDASGNRVAGGTTVLNENSFFFTGTLGGKQFQDALLPTSSMYGLSLDDARELIVLQEAFHANDVKGEYDDNKPNDDEGNLAATRAINKKIRDACF